MAPKRALAKVIEVENPRDYVLARLAEARGSLSAAVEAIDDAIGAFVNPESDKKGRERGELIEAALDSAGAASRALEDAEGKMPEIDPLERPPWDQEDDGEDDEDEDDEEDDEDDED